MSTECTVCKAAVSEAIQKISINATADEVAAEFEGLCVAAGGGPEDPVADAVCTACAVVLANLINQLGWEWMKNNVDDAAQKVCAAADIC